MSQERPLPGKFVDLLRDGVRGPALSRSDVVKALRRVMMSAQRRGWSYPDIQAELMDTERNKLARQIADGKYAAPRLADGRHAGRMTTAAERDEFLRMHWNDTAAITASSKPWDREDAQKFIALVRAEADEASLSPTARLVLQAVLDLAEKWGTTQPTVPVHEVMARTGLKRMTAWRTLTRLCEKGVWLSLAERGSGNPAHGKANAYNLAPPLMEIHKGASPPVSQPVPVSHPPVSHAEGVEMVTGTSTLSDEEWAVILAMRAKAKGAAIRAGEVAIGNDAADNVTPIKRPRKAANHPTATDADGAVSTPQEEGEPS